VTPAGARQTLVTFRSEEPRALAQRFIATARRHARGWTVTIEDEPGSVQALTFEGAVSAVMARTGLTTLLIRWVDQ
jgi:hypothetical protein